MSRVITILLLIALTSSCKSQNCKALPTSFPSYLGAIKQVRNSNFTSSEKLNTDKSSWIKGLQFYSCDSKVGFLIIQTDNKEYIHQNLPVEIWNELKVAESFGSFYNNRIKNKYQLTLRQ